MMKPYFFFTDFLSGGRPNRLLSSAKVVLLSALILIFLILISIPAYPWLSNPFQSIVSSFYTPNTTSTNNSQLPSPSFSHIDSNISTYNAPDPLSSPPPLVAAPPPLPTTNSPPPQPPSLSATPPPSPSSSTDAPPNLKDNNWGSVPKDCDIFRGEWQIDIEEQPQYTNTTCSMIPDEQNCMKFGRPNMDFLKWRWKPYGCELPRFDAARFLEQVRGKSLAFVGDSVAGNHMHSLLCLLSKAEFPKDIPFISRKTLHKWPKHVIYTSYNFTMTMFWSPQLIKIEEAKPGGGQDQTSNLDKLYLDKVDKYWLSQIEDYDYVVLSGRHWFSRPSLFYQKGKVVGCCYCRVDNVPDLTLAYSHRMAFRTALRAINKLTRFKGMLILRTVSPSHFEYGEWNEGGDCPKTMPFKSKETKFEGMDFDVYRNQVEEFEKAKREAEKRGLVFKLLDATMPMALRPDGHPSKYGHVIRENERHYNDCVHWCMPGPIDTWNDFLLHLLRE